MDKKQTHIGGQAVLEGVMMRGKSMYTLAVREPNNNIFIENKEIKSIFVKFPILKLPVLRGMVAFVESLVTGTKIMTRSADIAGIEVEDDKEASKFDKFLSEKLGDKLGGVITAVAVIFSLFISLILFTYLPVFISSIVQKVLKFESTFILTTLEGVIKLIIFLTYMYLITFMEDIKRVFMYHGAEHKTINCFESGQELTVENVKKHTRLHKRCGTSFLLITMVISIIIFMLFPMKNMSGRIIVRTLLMPIVAGISYEFIRFAGSSDSKIISLLSKPGLMLQNLTTVEPDEEQIEVAIAAMKGVLEAEPEYA